MNRDIPLIRAVTSAAPPRLSRPVRYAIAPAAVLLVALVQYTLLPEPAIAPFVFFYFIIALVSWLAGRGPGLLTVVLSGLVANYFFVPPHRSWALSDPAITATGLFVISAGAVAFLCAALGEVVRDVHAAQRSAEHAKTIAETANHAKDHFLAVLSHELRTPLTPVLTGISILQKDPSLSERARNYVDIIRRNVELEARLIDDLLDLTRVARGKVELSTRPVELRSVIERAVDVCRADIDARRLHFGVDFGPGHSIVEADHARLQQVFWNLLKNAIKFTPDGGCVGIRCRDDGAHVVVQVSDSGIGIDAANLGLIFDPFIQAPSSRRQPFSGLGLGLAISRALVEAHGGTISASSEGHDRGSTFHVRLPTVSVGASAVTEPATPREARPAADRRRLRVLLVEDHGDSAEMIASMLRAAGHTVVIAGDVATALRTVATASFDLLLSDIGLPDASGRDLMREIRARGYTLPGIAVSGYGHEQDIQQTRAAGFRAHLVKPFDPERLLEALERGVGGSAASQI